MLKIFFFSYHIQTDSNNKKKPNVYLFKGIKTDRKYCKKTTTLIMYKY